MPKNQVQFQKGMSLPEFFAAYGTEAQCAETLFRWRWPEGFVCPACGHAEGYCDVKTRGLLQCKHCRHQTSLTAGTLFAYSKLPLTTWFLAMYLLTQHKNAVSALALKRQLGVSYNTAWSIKHKLMQTMLERDAERQLTGVIEIDDAYWGGECHGQRPGRGSPNKTPFVAALVKSFDGHPLALRLSVVEGFRKRELAAWTEKFIHPDSIVVSDGLGCFRGVAAAGVEHQPVVTGGGAASMALEEFRWLNTVLGNVKNALRGTYHKASPQHLPRYLAEFCYRFNRRFDLAAMLPRLGYAAVRTPPMPYRLLKLAEAHW
jgi:transposase-like protein